jgi:hypothetical protein
MTNRSLDWFYFSFGVICIVLQSSNIFFLKSPCHWNYCEPILYDHFFMFVFKILSLPLILNSLKMMCCGIFWGFTELLKFVNLYYSPKLKIFGNDFFQCLSLVPLTYFSMPIAHILCKLILIHMSLELSFLLWIFFLFLFQINFFCAISRLIDFFLHHLYSVSKFHKITVKF